jgi:uncharacterized lipoprotein YmbA
MTPHSLFVRVAAPALLALAAGCSSTPDHFHTLRPAQVATTSVTHAATQLLAIGPVTVPDALGRDEWVIRTGATGATIYGHQLWTQGLGADVAQSLVDYLNRGALGDAVWADAGPTGSGSGADLDRPPTVRVRVQVLRFDSLLAPEPSVSDQVRWTLECLPSDSTLAPIDAGRYRVVRGAVREVAAAAPAADAGVDEGQRRYDRIARAHSQTVRLVADDIAAAWRDSAAERARDCVAAPR